MPHNLDFNFSVRLEQSSSVVRHRLEFQGVQGKKLAFQRQRERPTTLQVPRGVPVRTWGVVNDKLNDWEEFSPVARLTSGHVI